MFDIRDHGGIFGSKKELYDEKIDSSFYSSFLGYRYQGSMTISKVYYDSRLDCFFLIFSISGLIYLGKMTKDTNSNIYTMTLSKNTNGGEIPYYNEKSDFIYLKISTNFTVYKKSDLSVVTTISISNATSDYCFMCDSIDGYIYTINTYLSTGVITKYRYDSSANTISQVSSTNIGLEGNSVYNYRNMFVIDNILYMAYVLATGSIVKSIDLTTLVMKSTTYSSAFKYGIPTENYIVVNGIIYTTSATVNGYYYISSFRIKDDKTLELLAYTNTNDLAPEKLINLNNTVYISKYDTNTMLTNLYAVNKVDLTVKLKKKQNIYGTLQAFKDSTRTTVYSSVLYSVGFQIFRTRTK